MNAKTEFCMDGLKVMLLLILWLLKLEVVASYYYDLFLINRYKGEIINHNYDEFLFLFYIK